MVNDKSCGPNHSRDKEGKGMTEDGSFYLHCREASRSLNRFPMESISARPAIDMQSNGDEHM